MNFFSIIGLTLATAVVAIGISLATDDPTMFIDYPSLFIVTGGTLAATAVSFQLNKIFIIFKIFIRRILGQKSINLQQLIKEIMQIVEGHRNNVSIETFIDKTKDLFLKDALKIVHEGMLDEKRILQLLKSRASNIFEQHQKESNKIKVLSKFPPAFGMMGTTIGMVVLLSNLGGKDAIKTIGPSMAVCLITTLYGLVLANVILIPAAENLSAENRDILLKNTIIVAGMRLLLNKDNPVAVAEELNTFIPPGQRIDWRTVVKNK